MNVVRGFFMGAADIVPGVSGGTVALVLGIYERLVASIRRGAAALSRLARADVSGFRQEMVQVEWLFLLPLLAGILAAVVVVAGPITWLLDNQPRPTAGVFFGLIVGSIYIAWQLLTNRDSLRFLVMGATAVAAFFLLGLRSGEIVDPTTFVFLLAGALAICAMILPGVSGSFLLLMVGMYEPVLDAVHDREIGTLAVFMVGATIGLALFSTLLNWLLEHHHDTMLAALIGLMIGSLRVLWPWPDGTDSTVLGAPDSQVLLIGTLAVAAAALVMIVSRLATRR